MQLPHAPATNDANRKRRRFAHIAILKTRLVAVKSIYSPRHQLGLFMRVLIADNFETSGREALAKLGFDVKFEPKLKEQALADAVRDLRPDVLVVRSTQVSEAILDAGPLKLVVRAGAGYNTIDVAAASKRGIYVSNCPGKNAIAVAELAIGLMLALDRRIPDNVAQLRAGRWNKAEFSKARGIYGRTLGLIGVGQIGKEMIPRGKALGMRVIAFSRSLTDATAAELGIERKASMGDVAAVADVVSVHLALSKETRGVINADFFARMKHGAMFINTARGEIVDQAALLDAMKSKGLRVGLDVYAAEPSASAGDFVDPILSEPNLYGTHHIGASTEQAQEAIAAETVRIIQCFKETGKVPNVVNLAKKTPATTILVVRHKDRPGVLASVLDVISGARINVQEMENIIFEGAQAAVAKIHLESAPTPATLDALRAKNTDILELTLIPIAK
jgi:D-3-phosphoglycerate dehydrogenase